MNLYKRVRAFRIVFRIMEVLVFKERGKLGYREKNLSGQGREPTTNSTHISRRRRQLNLGHNGGRQALTTAPPLLPLCSSQWNPLTDVPP